MPGTTWTSSLLNRAGLQAATVKRTVSPTLRPLSDNHGVAERLGIIVIRAPGPITRSQVILLGASESSGATVANLATATSSEVDLLLGDSFSRVTQISFYLKFTAPANPVGIVRVILSQSRVPGQPYQYKMYNFKPTRSGNLIFVDTIPSGRYITGAVQNLLQSGSLTNVFLALEVEQQT